MKIRVISLILIWAFLGTDFGWAAGLDALAPLLTARRTMSVTGLAPGSSYKEPREAGAAQTGARGKEGPNAESSARPTQEGHTAGPAGHPLLSVPIHGGTAEDVERVRHLLETLTSIIPASHVRHLQAIELRRIFLSLFSRTGRYYHDSRLELLMRKNERKMLKTLAHEIGHLVYSNMTGSQQIWQSRARYRAPPRLQYYIITYGLSLVMPILTFIVGWGFMGSALLGLLCPWLPAVVVLFFPDIFDTLVFLMRLPFVSDYAMKNEVEDFAETYMYYALHRDKFRHRAERNAGLRAKYEAMQEIFGDSGTNITPSPSNAVGGSDIEQREAARELGDIAMSAHATEQAL